MKIKEFNEILGTEAEFPFILRWKNDCHWERKWHINNQWSLGSFLNAIWIKSKYAECESKAEVLLRWSEDVRNLRVVIPVHQSAEHDGIVVTIDERESDTLSGSWEAEEAVDAHEVDGAVRSILAEKGYTTKEVSVYRTGGKALVDPMSDGEFIAEV